MALGNSIYNSLIEEEEKLLSALYSVRNLLTFYNLENDDSGINEQIKKETEMFKKGYDVKWSMEDKIKYLLKRMKKGTIDEIAKFLIIVDDSFNVDSAKDLVSQSCEELLKRGLIGSVKINKKTGYYTF